MSRRSRWTFGSSVVAAVLLTTALVCTPEDSAKHAAPRQRGAAASAVDRQSPREARVAAPRRAPLPSVMRPVADRYALEAVGAAGAFAPTSSALDEAREHEAADLESMRQVMVQESVDDAWQRSVAARAVELAAGVSDLMLIKADCRATICRVVMEHAAQEEVDWLASLTRGAVELVRVETPLHEDGLTRTELFLSR